MNAFVYILPLTVILIGVLAGFRLARAGRIRSAGITLLLAVAAFWVSMHVGETAGQDAALGLVMLAFLVVLPGAGGLFIGLITGSVRRWRDARA